MNEKDRNSVMIGMMIRMVMDSAVEGRLDTGCQYKAWKVRDKNS